MIKPFLLKFLPISFLRKVKEKSVKKSLHNMKNLEKTPFLREANPDGINLIGNIKGETGLGQSVRLIATALENTTIDFTVYSYEEVASLRSEDTSFEHKITDTAPYNINLIHINPYELALAYISLDKNIWQEKYNIGFWLWELEEYPEEWLFALSLLDEVWTPSDFAGKALKKETNKPVKTMPYYIEAPTNKFVNRSFFSLPENKFLYLCMYDSNSTVERKNPGGAIDAYKKAFPAENKDVGIVIKVNNTSKKDKKILKEKLVDYKNVYIIDTILEKTEVNSLISICDVFISLHRAEGFGLVLAESMKVCTPTVATNWSGNTEFMNENVACMVNFKFTKTLHDIDQYKKGSIWAEPDIEMAADFILKLYSDKDFYEKISKNAKIYIDEKLSLSKASKNIEERILEIYK